MVPVVLLLLLLLLVAMVVLGTLLLLLRLGVPTQPEQLRSRLPASYRLG